MKYTKHITLNIVLILYILLITTSYLIGAKPLVVMSNSMSPAISKGDLLIILKTKQYVVNDIISFLSKGEIVTHRIISNHDEHFQTKGDSNELIDFGLVTNANILGKVKLVIPFLGFLFMYLQSKYFSYVLLALVVFMLFKKIIKRVQNVKI